jgi:c-di-GMP phosphodiesterase
MNDILIARHPVFDKDLDIVGFDIIVKEYSAIFNIIVSDQYNISHMIPSSLLGFDTKKLSNHYLSFFPITPQLINDNLADFIDPKNTALEINKTFNNDKCNEQLQYCSKIGFTIVYDGFDIIEKDNRLFKIIDIFKIDYKRSELNEITAIVKYLSKNRKKTLVKNINSLDEFDICRKIGIDYFQGSFIWKPHKKLTQKMFSSRIVILRFLSRLNDPKTEFEEIAELIKSDATLSYKLLRLINSAYYAMPKKIESIQQALIFIGMKKIKNWASLLLLSSVTDTPSYLIYTALERAKMCELLSNEYDSSKKDIAFLIGLFSVLDSIFDMPLKDVLSTLSLSEEIENALLFYDGKMGEILMSVISYQKGEWIEAFKSGFDHEIIRNAFIESLDWMSSFSAIVNNR